MLRHRDIVKVKVNMMPTQFNQKREGAEIRQKIINEGIDDMNRNINRTDYWGRGYGARAWSRDRN